jgi:galactose-1-phosphate uridylyltransferase
MGFEKVDWDEFPLIKQRYTILTKDKTISVKKQQKMMKNLDVLESVFIDSDHMVMLSHPKELAEILIEFYDKCIEERNDKRSNRQKQ